MTVCDAHKNVLTYQSFWQGNNLSVAKILFQSNQKL